MVGASQEAATVLAGYVQPVLLELLFDPEDQWSMFLGNVYELQHCTASNLRKRYSSNNALVFLVT
jgi:hypothetical protein